MTNTVQKTYVIESQDADRVLTTNDWEEVLESIEAQPLVRGEKVLSVETLMTAPEHEVTVSPVDDDDELEIEISANGVQVDYAISCTCGRSYDCVTENLIPITQSIWDWDGDVPSSFEVECMGCDATKVVEDSEIPFSVVGLAWWTHHMGRA